MNKTFKIADILSTDVRSRANAEIIRAAVDGIEGPVILDFEGVTFISRSFTDELYTIMNEHGNLTLANMSDFVRTMFDAVSQSRKRRRVLPQDNSEIKECNDMESLSSFLATI